MLHDSNYIIGRMLQTKELSNKAETDSLFLEFFSAFFIEFSLLAISGLVLKVSVMLVKQLYIRAYF